MKKFDDKKYQWAAALVSVAACFAWAVPLLSLFTGGDIRFSLPLVLLAVWFTSVHIKVKKKTVSRANLIAATFTGALYILLLMIIVNTPI